MTDRPSRRLNSDRAALEENRAAEAGEDRATEVEKPTTIDLGYIELNKVKALHFASGPEADRPGRVEWVYDPNSKDLGHGPLKIPTLINNEEGGDLWFLFVICGSCGPQRYLVRSYCAEDARQKFIDAQVEQLKIEAADLKDYGVDPSRAYGDDYEGAWDDFTGDLSSDSVPVDMDNVRGGDEIFLTRIDLEVR